MISLILETSSEIWWQQAHPQDTVTEDYRLGANKAVGAIRPITRKRCRSLLSVEARASRLMMEVTYTTTMKDYLAFNRHIVRRSAVLWRLVVFEWIALTVVLGYGATALAINGDVWLALISAALCLLSAAFFPSLLWTFLNWLNWANARRTGTRGVIGRITLVLNQETLLEITETTRTEARWKDIKGAEIDGDYTFIYVTGLSAAILPRHGFSSDKEYQAVQEFALARMEQRAQQERR
jgi:hypothetical protein